MQKDVFSLLISAKPRNTWNLAIFLITDNFKQHATSRPLTVAA
jgi:hypothetical protein